MEQTEKAKTETTTNWLQEEAEQLKSNQFDGEKLPAMIFEENKNVTFKVDFSEKFEQWTDSTNGNVKAIIPVEHKGEKKILWLNMKNPLYTQLVIKGLEGTTEFKVLQVGSKKDTRYVIVEDEE